jgi:triosephosphate isomerase
MNSQRTYIVAANWKMHMPPSETAAFLRSFLRSYSAKAAVDIVIAPPFVSMPEASTSLGNHPAVELAAQNMSPEPAGAYTGEISAAMLLELKTKYVILGHSERRAIFGEDDAFINRKVLAAQEARMTPILCVGETLEDRDGGRVEQVLKTQLEGCLKDVGLRRATESVIAYEPVWAIGTGRNASPEQAQEAHAFIRSVLAEKYGEDSAKKIRIQYGGSVKPNNAAELISQADVDGFLIGGASLEPGSFHEIIKAAIQVADDEAKAAS